MLLLLGKHRHFGHRNAGLIVDVCRGGWALGAIKVLQDAADHGMPACDILQMLYNILLPLRMV